MLALVLSPGLAPAGDLQTAGAPVDVAAAALAPVPVELQRLVKLGETAANTKRPAALATLAAAPPAKAFDWVTYSSETWQCDVLVLPQPGNPQAAGLTKRHATRFADFHGGDRRNEERLRHRQSADTHAAPYLAVFHAWHTCEGEGDHVYRLIHTGRGWKLGEEIPESAPGAFRIRDHNLNVRIDVPGKKAAITDDFRVERTEPAVPEYGLFRISQDFQIHRLVQTGSSETPIVFHQVGGVVAFVPPQASSFTLSCAYASTLTHSMSDYIKADEAAIVSYWYPHIARLPATTTVTTLAPPGWTALAQGEAVRKEPQSDGSTLVVYRNDIPNSFFTLDMGRYKVTNRSVKGRTLSVYQLKPDGGIAQACLNTLERAIEFYSERFGEFPYSRYGVVETRGDFPGALEAYSFATFGPHTLPALIPHELSHTWWGGMVPCTYTRSMWNEAFAEYSDDLFNRSAAPEQYAREHPVTPDAILQSRLQNSRAFRLVALGNAYNTMDDRQERVGYEKGKLVMRALEDQLGQDVLIRCLHAFVVRHHRGDAAEWSNFAAVVNKETGQDYGWFFAEWIGRAGMPAVRLTNVATTDDGTGQWVEADIVQEGAPYRMKMAVRLEQQDGTVVDTITDVHGATTHIRVRATSAPARLSLDPEGKLPLAEPAHQPDHTDAAVYEWPPR